MALPIYLIFRDTQVSLGIPEDAKAITLQGINHSLWNIFLCGVEINGLTQWLKSTGGLLLFS